MFALALLGACALCACAGPGYEPPGSRGPARGVDQHAMDAGAGAGAVAPPDGASAGQDNGPGTTPVPIVDLDAGVDDDAGSEDAGPDAGMR